MEALTRRRFLAAVAAAGAGGLRAQGRPPRVIGVLTGVGGGARGLSAAMAERGWAEGRDVRYELRRAASDDAAPDREAAELIASGAEVLVGVGVPIMRALARATRTLPIVCMGVSDPVGEGLAVSLQRPGKNVTGLSFGLPEAAVLQVGALQALVPGLKRIAFITSEDTLGGRPAPAHDAAAARAGVAAELVLAHDAADLERVLGALRPTADAAWIAQLPADVSLARAAALAIGRRIATHARGADAVRAGLLLSYWLVHADVLRRVAALLDKVLRGEDPARLPFELPDRVDFALNRATAAALGLRIPAEMLLRATELV